MSTPISGETYAPPSARLERLPHVTRSHMLWATVLSVMFVCEIADVYALATTAPAFRDSWGLSITQIGALTSLTFVGMVVGAIAGGRLSDRLGRKRVLVYSGIFYSVCSMLCALAPGYTTFAVLRLLIGVGIQAVIGVLLVYVMEMFPRVSRGRYLSLMIGIGGLGVPLMALTARAIVPMGPDAWRWVFVIGGIGLLPSILAAILLPESVRWQELHRRPERASDLVDRLEAEVVARTGKMLPAVEARAPEPQHSLGDLFGTRYRRRTTVACTTMFFGIMGYYGFNNWVPTLLVERGLSTAEALTITSVLAFAPIIGALTAMLVSDRWNRRRTAFVLSLPIAASMLAFALVRDQGGLVTAGFAAAFLLQAYGAILYAYLPEIFPTALRGIGSGLANGAGRTAGIASGFLIAALAGWFGFAGVFTATAAMILVSGIVVGLYGEDTRGRSMDEISADRTQTASQRP